MSLFCHVLGFETTFLDCGRYEGPNWSIITDSAQKSHAHFCTSLCRSVHICTSLCTSVHLCAPLHIHLHLCAPLHILAPLCASLHIYAHLCAHLHMSINLHCGAECYIPQVGLMQVICIILHIPVAQVCTSAHLCNVLMPTDASNCIFYVFCKDEQTIRASCRH
jgi:hypothetical protein